MKVTPRTFCPIPLVNEGDNQSLATKAQINEEEEKNGYELQVDFQRNFNSRNSEFEDRSFFPTDEQTFLLRKLNHYQKDT